MKRITLIAILLTLIAINTFSADSGFYNNSNVKVTFFDVLYNYNGDHIIGLNLLSADFALTKMSSFLLLGTSLLNSTFNVNRTGLLLSTFPISLSIKALDIKLPASEALQNLSNQIYDCIYIKIVPFALQITPNFLYAPKIIVGNEFGFSFLRIVSMFKLDANISIDFSIADSVSTAFSYNIGLSYGLGTITRYQDVSIF